MSKEYIPLVGLPSVTGTCTLESRRTGGSELAHEALPASNKAAAATSAGPQYFLMKACTVLCCRSISSLHFPVFQSGLVEICPRDQKSISWLAAVNTFLTRF